MGSNKKALKSVFKGGSISLLGTMASKFFSLIFRVIVGNFLGPVNYGLISLMISIFSVAERVSSLSMPQGVLNYVSKYRNKKPKKARGTIYTALAIVTVPSLLSALTLWLFAPLIATEIFNDAQAAPLIKMIALVLPIRIYGNIFVKVSVAFEHISYEVISERIWQSIIQILLTVLLVYFGYEYIGAAAAYLTGMATASFVALYLAYKSFPEFIAIKDGVDFNFREIFSHSWPLMAAGMFGLINGHIDTFMIQYFLGSESLGHYQAAYPLAMLLTVSSGMFGGIFHSNASKILQDGVKEVSSLYQTVVKWIGFTTIPLFSILFFFPKAPLMAFGSEYFIAQKTLQLLSIGLLASTMLGPINHVYQIFDRTKINLIKSAIIASSNIILNVLLLPRMGILGAAVASTISILLILGIDLHYCSKLLDTSPFKKSLIKIIGATSVSVFTIYIVNNTLFVSTPVWFYVVDMIIFGLMYIAVLIATDVFEKDDLVIMETVLSNYSDDVPILKGIEQRVKSKKESLDSNN